VNRCRRLTSVLAEPASKPDQAVRPSTPVE
jgi:hypothetical protein